MVGRADAANPPHETMIPRPHSPPGRSGGSALRALAVVALALATVTAGLAGAQSTATPVEDRTPTQTLSISDADLAVGETTNLTIRVSTPERGLQGYKIEVLSTNADVVTLERQGYPDTMDLIESPPPTDDGERIVVKATDANDDVPSDADGVPIARVAVTARSAGQAELRIGNHSITAGGGYRIPVDVDPGAVTVAGDGSSGSGGGPSGDSSDGSSGSGDGPTASPTPNGGDDSGGSTGLGDLFGGGSSTPTSTPNGGDDSGTTESGATEAAGTEGGAGPSAPSGSPNPGPLGGSGPTLAGAAVVIGYLYVKRR